MSKNLQKIFWAAVILLSIGVGTWAVRILLPARAWPRPVSKTSTPSKTKTPKPVSIAQTLVNFFIPTASPALTPSTATTTVAISTQTTVLPRHKPASIPQMSYGDAVTKYANSRIQFDQNCHAFPSQMAVANPVTLMLDNRSNVEQKITLSGKVYGVAAYNYVLVTLNQKALPQNIFINCNQGVNVVEIILE
jgi:hypothetical protein